MANSVVADVVAVSCSSAHCFSKTAQLSIRLLAGLGVVGDAHSGVTVKHRSRVAKDPTQINLRQAHLIHSELHDELRAKGFDVRAGELGENITTRGIDLLTLPPGVRIVVASADYLKTMPGARRVKSEAVFSRT